MQLSSFYNKVGTVFTISFHAGGYSAMVGPHFIMRQVGTMFTIFCTVFTISYHGDGYSTVVIISL